MTEFKGITSEEAIKKGLQALNLTKSEAKIEIITSEKKGFLGIGRKDAVVKVTPLIEKEVEKKSTTKAIEKQDAKATVQVEEQSEELSEKFPLENLSKSQTLTELAKYLTNITNELGAPSLVKVTKEQELTVFHLETQKPGIIIGKHGRVLNALQYLAQVFVHRVSRERIGIIVNVGDYRERRQATMERLAKSTARRVEETGQPVFLEPMPAFERKIIHGILTNNPYVETHSEGEEPHRYLVVEFKKNVF